VVTVVEDGGGSWLWWLEWWRKFVRVVMEVVKVC
jgi:hypothetical protein